MRDVRCVWPVGTILGEGPVWSEADAALWFVDIKGRQIHRFDSVTEDTQSWPAPDQVSFILPSRHGWHVAGLPGRLARFDPATGAFETLAVLETEPSGNRLNDACIDGVGRLWFGSMDDRESNPSGLLYRWDGTAIPLVQDSGFVISNGPAHSPDGKTFYHTDTVRRTISRYDVGADGSVSGKRPLIEIEDGAGYPDGTAVDQEGCLWIALFGGSTVRRYSPEGVVLEIVPLPCRNVTKLMFGGDRLMTAFVTTARSGSEEGADPSLDGGLFAFAVDVPGVRQQCLLIG